MKDFTPLLALPATLLAFIATSTVSAQDLTWPYNLPSNVKYFPEDEAHVKRNVEAQQRLAWQTPVGMKKMGSDATEKFWPHYWDFGQEEGGQTPNKTSASQPLEAAIAPHTNHQRPDFSLFGRSIFARDFSCPNGTNSCSSIGSNLCCPFGQDCVTISGSVGCCASGSNCGSSIAPCATSSGYTSCPNSPGGCCIPGASCDGTGCVILGTSTVQITLSTSTSTAVVSSSTAPPPAVATASGYTTTVTVTQSQSGSVTTIFSTMTLGTSSSQTTSASTTVSTQGTLTCTSGFQTCAASLGGGCCPTGQVCGTSSLCLDLTTSTASATAGAPILPTSVQTTSDTSMSVATTVSSTTANANCPTGYYVCSAYYLGGCCQVGQNCDTSSCPSYASTVILSSGPTVVVPAAATGANNAAGVQGGCAGGWYSCAASVGGGCCASGYVCGTVTCSATVSGQQNTGKEAASGASVVGWAWSFMILAVPAGVGMVWL